MARSTFLPAALVGVSSVLMVAAAVVGAATHFVGVNPADGAALLVKRIPVEAGSTVVGAEFDNNDPRTVFPEVLLVRGATTLLSAGTVVGRVTEVSESVAGRVTVVWALPVAVSQREDLCLAVRMPAGSRRQSAGIGAGVGVDGPGFANCFVAADLTGEFILLGVDLAMRLVTMPISKSVSGGSSERGLQRDAFLHVSSPGRGTASFEYGLRASSHATLDIYSIAGRRVRTLVSGMVDAGDFSQVWDGRDSRGRPVAAGVYVASLRSAVGTLTRKFVLAR